MDKVISAACRDSSASAAVALNELADRDIAVRGIKKGIYRLETVHSLL
jgi:hypothetical protein